MHILVVEQQKGSLSLIVRRLKAVAGKGLKVSRILGEQEGIQDGPSHQADIAVIEFPESTAHGPAVLEQHLKYYPHIPVVVIASNEQHTVDAFQGGAQGFLLKTECSGRLLLRELRNVCAKASLRQGMDSHGYSSANPNETIGGESSKGRTQELVSARVRIEAILNGSSNGILLFRPDAGVEHANEAAYRLFHASEDGFTGRSPEELFCPEYRGLLQEVIDDAVSQDSVQQIDVTALRLDGSTFDAQIGIAPIEYLGNGGKHFVCTVQDITTRKELEFSLLHYADELYDLYNQAPCGYYSTDERGIIIQINDTQLNWLGYRRDEVIHEMTIDRILTPESVTTGAITYDGFIKKGWLKDLEIEFVRKDGTVFPAMVSATAIYDETGRCTMSRSTVFDITDRKLAENALRESEEKFRQIAENIDPALFIVTDDRQQILYVSPAYETITGRTRQSLCDGTTSLLDFVHPEDQTRIKIETDTGFSSRNPYTSSEFRIVRTDGRTRWAQVRAFPIADGSGRVYRRIGIMEDITDHKSFEEILERALQQEKELGDLKSRFVSMASHEFRTPLATILATTESLSTYRQKMDDAQIDARLDKIRQQVIHMKEVMDDVLQLTRIQAGRIDFRPVEADLDALCRDIVEEFRSRAEYENRIEYSGEAGPVVLTMDPRLMRQAITNLLSNALKYSASNDLVAIRLQRTESQVTLQVQDDGIGIPPEDQKHLFEPFHRAKNVGAVSGTGLGLNIALQAISLHCGSIEITSTQDEGTTVVVILPLAA
ncbi:MAG: PAS domain S-box protein [Anaerolineae bacterium]|nr:PAS domain S-box protein [Anaerolineae bacterium]